MDDGVAYKIDDNGWQFAVRLVVEESRAIVAELDRNFDLFQQVKVRVTSLLMEGEVNYVVGSELLESIRDSLEADRDEFENEFVSCVRN